MDSPINVSYYVASAAIEPMCNLRFLGIAEGCATMLPISELDSSQLATVLSERCSSR